MKQILSLIAIPLCMLAIAAQQQDQPPRRRKPPQDGQGGRGGQGGVIKPAMTDTIHGSVYADNWFAMYINGKLVAVDSIDFLPHNVVSLDILPEYPMTIAVIAKDNADPKTGCEYGRSIGDGGIVIKFADATVTDASWKAKCIFHGPIDRDTANPKVRSEPIPENWFAVDYDDSKWRTPPSTRKSASTRNSRFLSTISRTPSGSGRATSTSTTPCFFARRSRSPTPSGVGPPSRISTHPSLRAA